MAAQVDPVCGMQVDERTAAGQSQHEGQTYYFCSGGCKQKFDEAPGRYAGGVAQGGSGQDSGRR